MEYTFNDLIKSKINYVHCSRNTKAYISSIFSKYLKVNKDLSNKILILEFSEAKSQYSFEKFQNIGDWIFFIKTTFPEHLNNASEEYYYSIAQISYYNCYKILNRKWPLFEELADKLPNFVNQLNIDSYRSF